MPTRAPFSYQECVGKDISQFFTYLVLVPLFGGFPQKRLQQLACLDVQSQGEIFGVVKLSPISFVSEFE